jgi:hypothetical protein
MRGARNCRAGQPGRTHRRLIILLHVLLLDQLLHVPLRLDVEGVHLQPPDPFHALRVLFALALVCGAHVLDEGRRVGAPQHLGKRWILDAELRHQLRIGAHRLALCKDFTQRSLLHLCQRRQNGVGVKPSRTPAAATRGGGGGRRRTHSAQSCAHGCLIQPGHCCLPRRIGGGGGDVHLPALAHQTRRGAPQQLLCGRCRWRGRGRVLAPPMANGCCLMVPPRLAAGFHHRIITDY